MKKFFFCLYLVCQFSWADNADTYKLNTLINEAVQQRDFVRARSLAVTQAQFDYVRLAEAESKQTANRKPQSTSCYTAGNRVMCY